MSQSNVQTIFIRLKNKAKRLLQELKALKVALSENLAPWYVKILITFAIAYALSPVDLIPDFIPILGLIDDLIIVPMLIYVIIRLIPHEIMEYCRLQASKQQFITKKNWYIGGIIIAIWIMLGIWLFKTLTKQ